MKSSRQPLSQTRRDAWVEINLNAIEQNTRRIRERVNANKISETDPDKKLMAILKADAYGHGAVMCAPTLEASGISMIGVASVDEALQLRDAGIELPILVIGMVPDWAMRQTLDEDIQITIFDTQRLQSLKRIYQETKHPIRVHIKVDTGMHRIGVHWEEAATFINLCQKDPSVKVEGVFSHLAATQDPFFTKKQIERWHALIASLEVKPPYLHLANSAGALHYPEAQGNLVRVGMALFGYDADPTLGLEPAMSLKARIIHLQTVKEGEGISYGPSFHVPEQDKPMTIATLPLGYADGVPRVLSNRIHGILRGQTIHQVGTITMDQMMFDVSSLPENAQALLGETITLIGQEESLLKSNKNHHPHRITLSDWARIAHTIEYELMCQLRVRLPKTYSR